MPEPTYKYDVFLSHNSGDKPAVEKIARLLRDDYQIKAWLDKWNLVPGDPWQEALEGALDDCRTVAVFLGPSGVGPWENEEMRAAIEERVRDPQRRVVPVLLPGAPDSKSLKLPTFLRRATWVDFRAGLGDKEALYLLDCGIRGQAPGDRGAPANLLISAQWYLAHPYAMSEHFTGRHAERNLLSGWLKNDPAHPLLIVCALGGFGKSALAWHWLTHDVDAQTTPKVVWWSFYEGDASFDNFLTATLTYLGLPNAAQVDPRQKTELLLNALQRPGLLLVLDGFERELRAYASMGAAYQADEVRADGSGGPDSGLDCVSPYADAFLRGLGAYGFMMRSKVLITTRLTPRAIESRGGLLQGCREEELRAMNAQDAVDFFHAQGIRGARAEIERACAAYGFHPLSLRILAGWIANDRQTPGDARAAARLDVTDDVIQNKHHILEAAFNSLNAAQRKLLGRIACFRAPVSYEALQSVQGSGQGNEVFDQSLAMLEKRGLLHWDRAANHYDLHPIVRRYAYDRLAGSDRAAAHTRLADYFAAVPEREKIEKLDDLAPVIELYHHMVRAGKLDDAFVLFRDRLTNPLYYQLGAYQQIIELLLPLFLDGENKPPRLKDESAQAWTLNSLANNYALSGQPRRAVPLFEMQNALREKAGDKQNIAVGLGNVAYDQMKTGVLAQAGRNLRRSIDLCREIQEDYTEFIRHRDLGLVLSYIGKWEEARREIDLSNGYWEKEKHIQAIGLGMAYYALWCLLMARAEEKTKNKNLISAIEHARRALELADETARIKYPHPRDYIRAHWLLGAAYRASGVLPDAETHLGEALRRCRAINLVDHEADILLEVAKLRHAQGDTPEALRLAREALLISERSGYALQGADVNLFLAELALTPPPLPKGRVPDRGDGLEAWGKEVALEHARQARALATCDGGEYVYKVAYDEAGRLIERLENKGRA